MKKIRNQIGKKIISTIGMIGALGTVSPMTWNVGLSDVKAMMNDEQMMNDADFISSGLLELSALINEADPANAVSILQNKAEDDKSLVTLFTLINEKREAQGLPPYHNDMDPHGQHPTVYLTQKLHIKRIMGQEWNNPGSGVNVSGLPLTYCMARGQHTSEEVIDTWMNDPHAREIILNENPLAKCISIARRKNVWMIQENIKY